MIIRCYLVKIVFYCIYSFLFAFTVLYYHLSLHIIYIYIIIIIRFNGWPYESRCSTAPRMGLSVEERIFYLWHIKCHRIETRQLESHFIHRTKIRDNKLPLILSYKRKIETELEDICSDIMDIIKNELIPKSAADEEKVFYCKVKGNHDRCVSSSLSLILL